jgi:hypothetical protein
MPVFIELVTDAFAENLGGQILGRAGSGQSSRAGNRIARRPTRGLEIKEDTYAAIKVILSDGSELPLIDSSSRDGVGTGGYTNFILQNVSEARMEKHQIVETFGASYIFFFGENPRFLDVQAVLINSHDFNWEAEWWENYNENFRGTKLVEKGGRLYMFYDDSIVEGYMLMCQATKSSSEPHLIQMSFRLFLTNYRNISFIGDPRFPIHDEAVISVSGDDPAGIFGPPSSVPGEEFGATPQLSSVLADLVAQRGLPLRSLIADNFDEYVGLPENQVASGISPYNTGGLPTVSPATNQYLEADDLNQEAINQLGAQGVDVNNPRTLSDLGMMPNFESDARSPASFAPKEKDSFSFDTNGESAGDDRVDPTSSFRQDPLGAVFGASVSLNGSTVVSKGFGRESDNRFTEGAGDPGYGFRSQYAVGAGFGEVGFGDFGGPGFGSGTGNEGDPGFKDPSRFTFAGVAQNKAAFVNFRRPRVDQTSFGKGQGIASASAGASGGASVHVGGKPSPFSLVSVGGSLSLF